jgi:hypothetical protein
MVVLGEHLLYIDITSACPFKCEFCMYADKHGSPMTLKWTSQAAVNLARLINSTATAKITISGEGEPLLEPGIVSNIILLSAGNKQFEVISSGFRAKALVELVERVRYQLTSKQDYLNLRISLDKYHLEQTNQWGLRKLFNLVFTYLPGISNLGFSFRSIFNDKALVHSVILDYAKDYGFEPVIQEVSILEDRIIVNDQIIIPVIYKNLVRTGRYNALDELPLFDYIHNLEVVYGKAFTFGYLGTSHYDKGLDITIKPNGDVYFYGVELRPCTNIHDNHVDEPFLTEYALSDPFVRLFYTHPLTKLLQDAIEIEPRVRSLVESVNNPYWIVKEISQKHQHVIECIIQKYDS